MSDDLDALARAWGVPILDPTWEAEGPPTFTVKWGSLPRRRRMWGCYHFYTGDYKFASVWRHPDLLVHSGCATVIEVNYSARVDTPRAQVLFDIYRKRALAAYWGARGIGIIVDLNLNPVHADLAMVGVPRGWRAYATRKHFGMGLETIADQYQSACERAGDDAITFLVVGGGKAMAASCEERGWSWLPEDADVARGRVARPSPSPAGC